MNSVSAAIYAKLTGSSALTSLLASAESVYEIAAPEGAVLPYVVFSVQSGLDVNITKMRLKNYIYFIRAYAKGEAKVAGAIDAQIDTLMHNVPLSITGWANLSLQREDEIELSELTPAGENVFMAGGLYRLLFDK